MHTFWLSYPFQWNTSTDISTFVRNYFKSSIHNLYFLFRKFHSTFSVLFLLVSCTFEITIIRWQNSIRNSIILLKRSAHKPLCHDETIHCLEYLGLSFFVHDRPFKPTTDCRLSLLGAWKQKFHRYWWWHERAQMFWSAVEPQRVSVIRVSVGYYPMRSRYFDKLLFSTQRRSLLIYTHSLVWGFDCGRYGFW